MINMDQVYLEVQDLLAILDGVEYPDTYEYLSSVVGENNTVSASPYVIAGTVLGLDKPGDFPEYVIDFVTHMYELEIGEENDQAMNDLGAQYYDGHRGFEQSFEKAMYYYDKAAEYGNRAAQENLGYCYYYGRNGQLDYERAFHYFALGAFDGNLVSLYKIGDMYYNGLYVEKNEKEAFSIYMRCIETMSKPAESRVAGPVYLRLGRLFLDGIGVEQNLKNALVCYQKAESFLYDMVMNGEAMYRDSLNRAVAGQERTRRRLAETLPEDTWDFDR